VAGSDEKVNKTLMKRVKANDPAAIFQLGVKCYNKGDNAGAVKYYTKAAALGDIHAHYNLSCSYRTGEGVEKDEKKEIYHLEEAAIGGHPSGSYNLGCIEEDRGNYERAAKHYIIAANLGHDKALDEVKKRFMGGDVSKEDYASSLRGHQAAVAATKSTQREEAYAFFNQRRRV
jgi:tetratricopeptide (TPR) repeat protein